MAGFGGVAEYGITVRWDKNFLKLVRLLLERRAAVRDVRRRALRRHARRVEDAFAMGFDHIALCVGAGRPTVLDMPNGLARGVRAASDFLMALQLTGAAKRDSIANLQMRLPVVVIGGGLTAIDTATEVARLLRRAGREVPRALRDAGRRARRGGGARRAGRRGEREIADEFLAHARAIRAERAAAAREGRAPRLAQLLNRWGGVTIAYRRRLIDTPVLHAEPRGSGQGAGGRHPLRRGPDAASRSRSTRFGHAAALRSRVSSAGETVEATLPARAILVAAGTQPNTVLAREDATHSVLDGKYFQRASTRTAQPVDAGARSAKPARRARADASRTPTAAQSASSATCIRRFSGNVVKAMGGAKQGYPVVSRVLRAGAPPRRRRRHAIPRRRSTTSCARRSHAVERLTPTIVEVVVRRAGRRARASEPGQFYRLQNYETLARDVPTARALAMEGLALTGAWVDREQGLVSMIVLEMGGSSDLCALLEARRAGDR